MEQNAIIGWFSGALIVTHYILGCLFVFMDLPCYWWLTTPCILAGPIGFLLLGYVRSEDSTCGREVSLVLATCGLTGYFLVMLFSPVINTYHEMLNDFTAMIYLGFIMFGAPFGGYHAGLCIGKRSDC